MLKSLLIFIISVFIFTGCGGGGSSSSGSTTVNKTGILIDNVISNVKYVNEGNTGFTDSSGSFPYKGNLVEFFVGNIKIGELNELPVDGNVFIQDIVGVNRTNTADNTVVKIAVLLQSLDSNSLTDEIEISSSDFDKFNSESGSIDDIDKIDALLTSKGFTPISEVDAKRHMSNVLEFYDVIEDNISPELQSSSIVDGASNIALNSNIVLTFTDDLMKNKVNDLNIELKDSSANIIPFSFTHNFNVITITPTNNFDYSTEYSITLKTSIQDFGKNILTNAGGNTNTVITFTTLDTPDTEAPVLSSTTQTFTTTVGAALTLQTVTANDSVDGVTTVIKSGDTVDFNTAGTYNVVYTSTDIASNSSTITHTYIVTAVSPATISHNDFTYNIITSPITGKKWLDRNLGATNVCTESRDSGSFNSDAEYVTSQEVCFGDLYQWGRLTDGHEKTDSSTITTRAIDISSAGVHFITNSSFPSDWVENTSQDENNVDDDGTLRIAQWSKTDGTSICPIGFRVPTSTELYAETTQYSGTNDESTGAVKVIDGDTAFKNFLKFPVSGHRRYLGGSLGFQGSIGYVWSSSVSGTDSRRLYFTSISAGETSGGRAFGFSVRCVKD